MEKLSRRDVLTAGIGGLIAFGLGKYAFRPSEYLLCGEVNGETNPGKVIDALESSGVRRVGLEGFMRGGITADRHAAIGAVVEEGAQYMARDLERMREILQVDRLRLAHVALESVSGERIFGGTNGFGVLFEPLAELYRSVKLAQCPHVCWAYCGPLLEKGFDVLGVEGEESITAYRNLVRNRADQAMKHLFETYALQHEIWQWKFPQLRPDVQFSRERVQDLETYLREDGMLSDAPYDPQSLQAARSQEFKVGVIDRTRDWMQYLEGMTPVALICSVESMQHAGELAVTQGKPSEVIYRESRAKYE